MLGRLAALIKKFVHRVSLSRGLSEAAATAAGGKIYTFGSYRLGVHGPGTDIDTLCVAPRQVTREDFFGVLEGMLRETEGVTDVAVRVARCTTAGLVFTMMAECSGSVRAYHHLRNLRYPHRPFVCSTIYGLYSRGPRLTGRQLVEELG